MENITDNVGSLLDKTKLYTNSALELYRLKAIDKSADIVSTLAARTAVSVFVMLFFLMVNIGISMWLGEVLGKNYFGFFIVSGFYAIGAAVLYALRNRGIRTSVRNSIIERALN